MKRGPANKTLPHAVRLNCIRQVTSIHYIYIFFSFIWQIFGEYNLCLWRAEVVKAWIDCTYWGSFDTSNRGACLPEFDHHPKKKKSCLLANKGYLALSLSLSSYCCLALSLSTAYKIKSRIFIETQGEKKREKIITSPNVPHITKKKDFFFIPHKVIPKPHQSTS